MSNFLGGFATYTQLPAIDNQTTIFVGDYAYTLDDGAMWLAIQPAAPPGAVPAWSYIDTMRGSSGPQGPPGVGLTGPQGQIGPQGQLGGRGPQGPPGRSSFSFLAHMFTVPDIHVSPVAIQVDDSSWMNAGALLYIPGAGTFTVVGTPPNSYTVNIVNSGDSANAPVGTMISAGTMISPATQRGPAGPQGGIGPAGPTGPQGVGGVSVFSTLTQAYTLPDPTGSPTLAFVANAASFATGQIVFVEGGDYCSVLSTNDTNNTLSLKNLGFNGTATGTICPVGNNVSGTGPRGPQGATGPQGVQGIQGVQGVAPPGVILMYGAFSAPAGWLICDGSAVSRTQYAGLFAIIATAYGSGDGTSTFNLPNLAGRFALGASGSHALASVGGTETHALTIAELANHGHVLAENPHVHPDPGHTHGGTAASHAHTHSAQHAHSIPDPGHYHDLNFRLWQGGYPGGGQTNFIATGTDGSAVALSRATGITGTNAASVGNTDASGALGLAINAAVAGLGGQVTGITMANTGSGTAFSTMPPYQTVNYIIKT